MQCLYYLQKQKKCGKRSFGGKGNALLLTIAYVIGYRMRGRKWGKRQFIKTWLYPNMFSFFNCLKSFIWKLVFYYNEIKTNLHNYVYNSFFCVKKIPPLREKALYGISKSGQSLSERVKMYKQLLRDRNSRVIQLAGAKV